MPPGKIVKKQKRQSTKRVNGKVKIKIKKKKK